MPAPSYAVTKSFAVELSYRYLNLGDGKTGDTINLDGTNLVNNPTTVKDITSHDVRLGVRWTCCDDETSWAGLGLMPMRCRRRSIRSRCRSRRFCRCRRPTRRRRRFTRSRNMRRRRSTSRNTRRLRRNISSSRNISRNMRRSSR